jgi:hypothetical protein
MKVKDSLRLAEHVIGVLNEKMVLKDVAMCEPEALMYHRACDLLSTWFSYHNELLRKNLEDPNKETENESE